MKAKVALFLTIMLLIFPNPNDIAAESRFALVIGNGNYAEINSLKNTVSDAKDVAISLSSLGFVVELLLNASLDQMDRAVIELGKQLSSSQDAVGFFYYAGHGVQSGGENYLIPVDAKIPNDSFLGERSLSIQSVLQTFEESSAKLDIIVLDACRDNPFAWSRSLHRGLSIVTRQPPSSLIAYAASAGEAAEDGTGQNGTYTGQLLHYLASPGLDIESVFKLTGAAVNAETNGRQHPAVYSQFYGKFYLADTPSGKIDTGDNKLVKNSTSRSYYLGLNIGQLILLTIVSQIANANSTSPLVVVPFDLEAQYAWSASWGLSTSLIYQAVVSPASQSNNKQEFGLAVGPAFYLNKLQSLFITFKVGLGYDFGNNGYESGDSGPFTQYSRVDFLLLPAFGFFVPVTEHASISIGLGLQSFIPIWESSSYMKKLNALGHLLYYYLPVLNFSLAWTH